MRDAIVTRDNKLMWYVDQLQGPDQVDAILFGHPDWRIVTVDSMFNIVKDIEK